MFSCAWYQRHSSILWLLLRLLHDEVVDVFVAAVLLPLALQVIDGDEGAVRWSAFSFR